MDKGSLIGVVTGDGDGCRFVPSVVGSKVTVKVVQPVLATEADGDAVTLKSAALTPLMLTPDMVNAAPPIFSIV